MNEDTRTNGTGASDRAVHRAGLAVLMCGVAIWTGCGEMGTVAVHASGEEAAMVGWPVEEEDEVVGFVDGWRFEFSTLVVSIHDVRFEGSDGTRADLTTDRVLVDLHLGEPELWSGEIEARRYERVGYLLAPPTAESRDVGPIDAEVRARMIAEGWSIYLEAVATRGELTRTLNWGIPLEVDNVRCEQEDGTLGLVVGARTEVELTLHFDHLFFDSLRVDEADMRFDAVAAMANDEGEVTFEALEEQRLASLRGIDGEPLVDDEGEAIFYDPGSFALETPTLRSMILAAATTIGHFQGEGHCEYITP